MKEVAIKRKKDKLRQNEMELAAQKESENLPNSQEGASVASVSTKTIKSKREDRSSEANRSVPRSLNPIKLIPT